MTTEQQQVRDWMKAFGQETPEKPMIPSFEVRKLRVKLMYEEFIKELAQTLGVGIYLKDQDGEWSRLQDIDDVDFCDDWVEEGPFDSEEMILNQLKEIADGCEDLKVVTEGTLVACGLVDPAYIRIDNRKESDPLFNEVMRSNWSKMWTERQINDYRLNNHLQDRFADFDNKFRITKVGDDRFMVKDQDGKVIKSPSYSPANLQPIIEEMSK